MIPAVPAHLWGEAETIVQAQTQLHGGGHNHQANRNRFHNCFFFFLVCFVLFLLLAKLRRKQKHERVIFVEGQPVKYQLGCLTIPGKSLVLRKRSGDRPSFCEPGQPQTPNNKHSVYNNQE